MTEGLPPPWGISGSGHLALLGDAGACIEFTPDGIVGTGALAQSAGLVRWNEMAPSFWIGVPAMSRRMTTFMRLVAEGAYNQELAVSVTVRFDHPSWSLGRPAVSPYSTLARNVTEQIGNALNETELRWDVRRGHRILGDPIAGPAMVRECFAAGSWSRFVSDRRVGKVVRRHLLAYAAT